MTTSRILAFSLVGIAAVGACSSEESEVQPRASTTTTTSSSSGAGGGGGMLPEPERHRATAETCTGEPPMGSPIPMEPSSECEMDSECTDGTNGRCVWPYGGGNVCMYDECFEDADCGSNSVCRCRGAFGFNTCHQGNCKIDEDCPNGYCSPSAVNLGPTCMHGISPGSSGYFCRTPADACLNDIDCGPADTAACLFDVDSASWQCHELLCTG